MAHRSAEEISRTLHLREPVTYFGDDDSDEELDYVEEDDEGSNFEEDADEFEFEEPQESEDSTDETETSSFLSRRGRHVYGKSKYGWSLSPPERQDRQSMLAIHQPGLIHRAATAETPLEFWSTLFTDNILEVILKHTNVGIDRYNADSNNPDHPYHRNLAMNELKAFLGLLYFGGLQNNNRVNTNELWSTEFGHSIYRVTMTMTRFEFIAARLRFDDKTTRQERKKSDGLAPVQEIWDTFINNCQSNYTPSDFLTVDEQLLGYRGNFSSRVYLKNKPERYGIKIITLNDAKTCYLYNAIPHVGKVKHQDNERLSEYYVRKICEPVYNSNTNITCDKWFTSVEIFTRMYKDYNLTMVGTIRKSKRQIPRSFKQVAPVGTIRHGYDGTNILMSWSPKRDKVVLMLSSFHNSCEISETSGKPDLVDFYNNTKQATEMFDQCCSAYSCARKTKRWTMRFFLGMLDQASVNSFILYHVNANHPTKNRRDFIKELVLALITPYLRERKNTSGVPRSTVTHINDFLRERITPADDKSDKLEKRRRCAICPYKKDKKTSYCCTKCKKPVCEGHRLCYCYNCQM